MYLKDDLMQHEDNVAIDSTNQEAIAPLQVFFLSINLLIVSFSLISASKIYLLFEKPCDWLEIRGNSLSSKGGGSSK